MIRAFEPVCCKSGCRIIIKTFSGGLSLVHFAGSPTVLYNGNLCRDHAIAVRRPYYGVFEDDLLPHE